MRDPRRIARLERLRLLVADAAQRRLAAAHASERRAREKEESSARALTGLADAPPGSGASTWQARDLLRCRLGLHLGEAAAAHQTARAETTVMRQAMVDALQERDRFTRLRLRLTEAARREAERHRVIEEEDQYRMATLAARLERRAGEAGGET